MPLKCGFDYVNTILESILSEEKEENVQNSASIAKVMYKKQINGSKLITDLCHKIFN